MTYATEEEVIAELPTTDQQPQTAALAAPALSAQPVFEEAAQQPVTPVVEEAKQEEKKSGGMFGWFDSLFSSDDKQNAATQQEQALALPEPVTAAPAADVPPATLTPQVGTLSAPAAAPAPAADPLQVLAAPDVKSEADMASNDEQELQLSAPSDKDAPRYIAPSRYAERSKVKAEYTH